LFKFVYRKYLLGFRKRKQERKKKAKEELEEQIKQEKKRQRELVIKFIFKNIFEQYIKVNDNKTNRKRRLLWTKEKKQDYQQYHPLVTLK
jgi:hypothetical protein